MTESRAVECTIGDTTYRGNYSIKGDRLTVHWEYFSKSAAYHGRGAEGLAMLLLGELVGQYRKK
jgi:hypothetical protein